MWYRYEHKEKLPNGDSISVRVGFDDQTNEFSIDDVGHTPKGRRKKIFLRDTLTNNYSYRVLNTTNRRKAEMRLFIEVAGVEALDNALNAAWQSARPKKIDINEYIE